MVVHAAVARQKTVPWPTKTPHKALVANKAHLCVAHIFPRASVMLASESWLTRAPLLIHQAWLCQQQTISGLAGTAASTGRTVSGLTTEAAAAAAAGSTASAAAETTAATTAITLATTATTTEAEAHLQTPAARAPARSPTPPQVVWTAA